MDKGIYTSKYRQHNYMCINLFTYMFILKVTFEVKQTPNIDITNILLYTHITNTTGHGWKNCTRRQERKWGEVFEQVAKFHVELSKQKS